MTSKEVTNAQLKTYQKLLQKKYRDQMQMFLVEGPHLVQEAQTSGVVLNLLTADLKVKSQFPKALLIDQKAFNNLTQTEHSQGIIAVCQKPLVKPLGQSVLVLENIQDPGNLGTLIRTAVCFGYEDVLLSGCDAYNAKVIRSSQGAIFKINITQTKDVTQYFNVRGYQIIGAMLDPEANVYTKVQKTLPFMLVLGNEGAGISANLSAKLSVKVYIPIHFESLNVASAGAILLNHFQII